MPATPKASDIERLIAPAVKAGKLRAYVVLPDGTVRVEWGEPEEKTINPADLIDP
ncbi:hypothetical protein [Dinoroseobacter sp. S124A]|uniref:hypothetical protein n=1 Tax=Dinoroseobacter sp. S124A TaxID=3415128 RepID=UPI003C7B7D92